LFIINSTDRLYGWFDETMPLINCLPLCRKLLVCA
jgi:hypothetical protein